MTILAWVLLFLLSVSVVLVLHSGSKSTPRCPKCQGVMAEQIGEDMSVIEIVIHVVPSYSERKCELCGYTERWLP
jgi:hypothetical protein